MPQEDTGADGYYDEDQMGDDELDLSFLDEEKEGKPGEEPKK
jgi:hypothetical protein